MGRAHPQPAGSADLGQPGDLAGDLGRPRPVALECALDTWARRSDVTLPDAPLPLPPESIDDEAIDAAAKLLGAAERPIVIVGGGALDASAEVIALAEMLEAPVSSYRRGRGVVPSSHRLAVDMPVGHRLWKEADAVLAIGTRFFIQNGSWGIDKNLKVVRLDIDPEEPERYARPDVALVGDAAVQLRAPDGGAAAATTVRVRRAPRSCRAIAPGSPSACRGWNRSSRS